jgi:hypothetical protein
MVVAKTSAANTTLMFMHASGKTLATMCCHVRFVPKQ